LAGRIDRRRRARKAGFMIRSWSPIPHDVKPLSPQVRRSMKEPADSDGIANLAAEHARLRKANVMRAPRLVYDRIRSAAAVETYSG
jgi:hypothetical protein